MVIREDEDTLVTALSRIAEAIEDNSEILKGIKAHYDGTAGLIKGTAANTTATSGDHELTCFGTSGFLIIEFKKDENYTT